MHLYSKLRMDHTHEELKITTCKYGMGICNAKIYEKQQFLRNHSNHIKLKLTKFRKK